jgi:hypothetical protein
VIIHESLSLAVMNCRSHLFQILVPSVRYLYWFLILTVVHKNIYYSYRSTQAYVPLWLGINNPTVFGHIVSTRPVVRTVQCIAGPTLSLQILCTVQSCFSFELKGHPNDQFRTPVIVPTSSYHKCTLVSVYRFILISR